MTKTRIRWIAALVLLFCMTAVMGLASVVRPSASQAPTPTKTIRMEDDSAFVVHTAANQSFTGTHFNSAPEAPVNRRICDNSETQCAVIKLDYTGKEKANVGIGVLLGKSSNLAVKVNAATQDPAGDGWQEIILPGGADNATPTGEAIVESTASGLSDLSIVYYYIALGKYFGQSDVLYVLFGSKEGGGNGACIYDHIDIYDDMTFADGTITVGESEVVEAKIENYDYVYKHEGDQLGSQKIGNRYTWRYCDNDSYVMFKVVFEKDSPNAAVGIITKTSDNLGIRVSTDESKAAAEWELIGATGMRNLGAALAEPCNVSDPDTGDASFLMYYYRLGTWAKAGQPVYIRLGTKDLATGGGIQFADRVEFHADKLILDPVVRLEDNRTVVNVTDSAYLYDNVASNVSSNAVGPMRFADQQNYFIYKVVMPTDKKTGVYMKIMMGGTNRAMSFSKDGESWTQIATAPDKTEKWGSELVIAGEVSTYYYKLDNYIGTGEADGKACAVVYIKFHATNTKEGNGACVYTLEFLNGSISPESMAGAKLGETVFSSEIDVLDNSLVHASENSSTDSYFGQPGRKAAGDNAYFVYKVDLPAKATRFSISYNAINSLLFFVSQDGTTYENKAAMALSKDGDGAQSCVDLSDLLAKGKTFYLKFQGTRDQDSMLLGLYFLYDTEHTYEKAYTTESYQAFSTGDASEKTYWQNETTLNVRFTGNYREFNQTATGIYRFTYKEGAQKVHLFGEVGGTYLVSVSTDGEHWTDIASSGVQYYDTSLNPWYRTVKDVRWDISSYVMTAENTSRSVYIRISDPVSDNASGAMLRSFGIASCGV